MPATVIFMNGPYSWEAMRFTVLTAADSVIGPVAQRESLTLSTRTEQIYNEGRDDLSNGIVQTGEATVAFWAYFKPAFLNLFTLEEPLK
jgi:hypothetical protein